MYTWNIPQRQNKANKNDQFWTSSSLKNDCIEKCRTTITTVVRGVVKVKVIVKGKIYSLNIFGTHLCPSWKMEKLLTEKKMLI